MSRRLEGGAEAVWYVRAEGRVWGPYPHQRLAGFVKEGRISPSTLVCDGLEGPFTTAESQERLRPLFGLPPEEGHEPAADGDELALSPAPGADRRDRLSALQGLLAQVGVRPAPSAARPILVFAALSSLSATAFESVLAQHGPFERLDEGLWLVRGRQSPAALRNALSRRLRADDRLIAVDAPLDRTAWFNLGAEKERRARALWSD